MDYISPYADLIYFVTGGIAVCRYRLLTLRSAPKPVVIQVEAGGENAVLVADHILRDGILNRIADRDLIGIPFDMLSVALTAAGQHHIVYAEPDIDDYIKRGYPYVRTAQPATRGRDIERISIQSRDLLIGRARLQTTHSKPKIAADSLAAILDQPA
ncbi:MULTISPECIES: hypothetical protein [unclassified Burkholderia]|uniref:hypothetical protein n=1 Tax=unclassified Burkholderia TaxID=2613784 RepID=UPI001422BA64|nr:MULTISPECIES: hypothetical protein [unclassified Burkholderia]NIE81845.1 hypothetical protein [Burkholderia sp. Tr-860]NIF61191.1 hypothetical protein [Burkholderia sp. Cy-647]NIF93936.1 hypothetical protein [Burkholderia sp. Ax-1720]